MQEQIDYITVHNTTTAAVDGMTILNKGLFVGTKNYLFFIPEKLEEHTSREITTTTFSLDGKKPSVLVLSRLEEPSARTRDFEKFMTEELAQAMKIGMINLEEDIEQLKVTANIFGGSVLINETFRKVGWKGFVLKTGKKKKEVRNFYLSHSKLINK